MKLHPLRIFSAIAIATLLLACMTPAVFGETPSNNYGGMTSVGSGPSIGDDDSGYILISPEYESVLIGAGVGLVAGAIVGVCVGKAALAASSGIFYSTMMGTVIGGTVFIVALVVVGLITYAILSCT